MRRPLSLYVLTSSLLLLGLGGLYGGIAMLADPTGGSLQMADVLPLLPITNYVLPGIFLLLVMGLMPVFLAYALIARPQWNRIDKLLGPYWAWYGTLSVAVVLAVWLLFQSLYIGFKWPPQFISAANGILILGCSLMPAVRRSLVS